MQDALAATGAYSTTLHDTLNAIRDGLPHTQKIEIQKVLKAQEQASISMAEQLESLAAHYSQMKSALKESESGDVFGDTDLQGKLVR